MDISGVASSTGGRKIGLRSQGRDASRTELFKYIKFDVFLTNAAKKQPQMSFPPSMGTLE